MLADMLICTMCISSTVDHSAPTRLTPAKLDHTMKFRTPSPATIKQRRFTIEAESQDTPDCYNPVAFETPTSN